MQHYPILMDYSATKKYMLARLRAGLSDKLTYHGFHHTRDVLKMADRIARNEGVKGDDLTLVKTAALFHDSGFLKNKHTGHEVEGCDLAKSVLPQFGYTVEAVEKICAMIMSTKIPQSPETLLEKIICDADLDYLGREDFYLIGNSLFHELQAYELMGDIKAWNKIQVGFLSAHRFHTATNKAQREPAKQLYLDELKKLVETY